MERVIRTVIASILARGVVMIAPLVTIPVTLGYLGSDRFGLWMTISSLQSMLVFADLGIGNGVLTEIGKANGRGDRVGTANIIATSYLMVSLLAMILLLIFWSLNQFVPWQWLMNTTDPTIVNEAIFVGQIYLSCFIVGIPLNLIAKVQLGLQRGYITEIWNVLSSLTTMTCTLVAVHFRMPLYVLVLTVTVTPLVFMLMNTMVYFGRKASAGEPMLGRFKLDVARVLVGIGGCFFALSLFTTASLNCDNLIVSRLWGLDEVSSLEISSKPFKIILLFVSLLCMPLWSAYAEAVAHGEHSWIISTTRRLVIISLLVSSTLASSLFIAAPTIFRWWIGPNFQIDTHLLGALAFATLLPAITAPYFMFLNSSGNILVQVKIWACFLPVAMGLKVGLGTFIGVSGVPLGGAIAYLLIMVPSVIVSYTRMMGKMRGQNIPIR
jgi:O-antigen/teichoic acid export membrane protein